MAYELRFQNSRTPEQISDAYRAIGRFISSMSDLDAMSSSLLAALVQMNGEGHDLIAHSIDFNRKREIVRTLSLFHKGNKNMKEIVDLYNKADELMTIRHTVAHGHLATQGNKFVFGSVNLVGMGKYAAKRSSLVEASRLDDLSVKADSLTARMNEIATTARA